MVLVAVPSASIGLVAVTILATGSTVGLGAPFWKITSAVSSISVPLISADIVARVTVPPDAVKALPSVSYN